MKGIKLIIFFAAVIGIDSFILPALFGFRDSWLALLVLIVSILYLGPKERYVFYGLIFSVILEMFKGLNFGSLAIPFLLTVTVVYLLQIFLDTKYTYDTRFNPAKLILVSSLSVVLVHLFSMFYNRSIDLLYFRPMPNLIMVSEAISLVLIFNIIFYKGNQFNV